MLWCYFGTKLEIRQSLKVWASCMLRHFEHISFPWALEGREQHRTQVKGTGIERLSRVTQINREQKGAKWCLFAWFTLTEMSAHRRKDSARVSRVNSLDLSFKV
jgi:hypothetical protein